MKAYRSKLLFQALCLALSITFAVAAPSRAQETGASLTPQGGTFIAIDDGSTRSCVNINKSVVSMYLVDVKAKEDASWLPSWLVTTQDLGVKVNLTLTDPTTQNPKFTFPRALQLTPVGTTSIVTLPVKYALLTNYSFLNRANNPPTPIANVAFDLDFINIRGQTALATAVLSLIKFSADLPVPTNPYSTGVQLFGQFTNTLIQEAASGTNDDSPVATVAYDLSTTDTCKSLQLTEGTTGVIFDYNGPEKDGIIKTSEAQNYCYFLEDNDIVTFVAKTDPSQDCTHQQNLANYETLNNPQIVWLTNSYESPSSTGTRSPNLSQTDKTRALHRCQKVGIPDSACI